VFISLAVAPPVIGSGILADLTTLFTAVTTFAVVTGACALAGLRQLYRTLEAVARDLQGPPREPRRQLCQG
jgi:hypothetical protein